MRVHEFMILTDIHREDLTAICAQSTHFVADITLKYSNNDSEHIVDVKSLLGMLLVPIKAGTSVRLTTKGKDEEEAMHFIYGLFDRLNKR